MKKTILKVKLFALTVMALNANLMAQVIVTPDGPVTFCDGGSVNLNASGGTNYQWHKDGVYIPGANTASLNAAVSGNYRVSGTSGWVKQSPTGGTTDLNDDVL
jgi:hypothetical protein